MLDIKMIKQNDFSGKVYSLLEIEKIRNNNLETFFFSNDSDVIYGDKANNKISKIAFDSLLSDQKERFYSELEDEIIISHFGHPEEYEDSLIDLEFRLYRFFLDELKESIPSVKLNKELDSYINAISCYLWCNDYEKVTATLFDFYALPVLINGYVFKAKLL